MRLIYYSVVPTPDGKYERQWIQSIRSLRSHNRHTPVSLFFFDRISDEILRETERWNVSTVPLGDYRQWMNKRQHPHTDALATYPVLHNLRVLAEANIQGLSQAMYIDCDTFFFHDPEVLFDQCRECDWYAREIPGSRFSVIGPTTNFDDALFAEIAAHEGLRITAPFNLGVSVLNHRVWSRLREVDNAFLDYVWRLLVGIQRTEPIAIGDKSRQTQAPRAGTESDLQAIRALVANAAAPGDYERALPYPSDNWWIFPEIAWMLAAGRLNGLSQGVLTPQQVALGNEFATMPGRDSSIMAHYFSSFEHEFFQHVAPMQSAGLS